MSDKKTAVLIPCYNEELTIGKVVSDFRRELPEAEIYVYNNNSSDRTVEKALEAGAIVRHERRQGKGNVMRAMFSGIEADLYVLVDGDDTYPAESVREMIRAVEEEGADMANGDRLSNGTYTQENKRNFHNFGNNLVKNAINSLYGSNVRDIMTGYRVFNKAFVKNYPVMSKGFEIETEMTLHALDKRFAIAEIQIDYRDRPAGSFSKLNTFSDGLKVIRTIARVFKEYKPYRFFGFISLAFLVAGLACGFPVIREFILTSFIKRLPLAVLAASLEILACLSFVCGIILDTVASIDRKNYELRLMDFKGDRHGR